MKFINRIILSEFIFLCLALLTVVKEEHRLVLKKFGKRIETIRIAQKLTKVQLAFELNTGEKYIRELEKGNINPTTTTLLKLTEALDIQIKDLFDFEIRD